MSKRPEFTKQFGAKKKIKVTIGLCVKNVELIVKRAIDSIVNQDYPHELLEIIVVDGYSKDKTLQIIKKILSKNQLQYKIFYEKKGLAEARRVALENATGKYIVWVDGDTLLSHDYVRKLVEHMEKNSRIGISAGRFILGAEPSLVATLETVDWVVGDFLKKQFSDQNPTRICLSGSTCRVNVLKQVGGFDPEIIGAGEDEDIAYKVKKAGWEIEFGVDALLQHKAKKTWRNLWKQNFWYGYGGHFIIHRYGNKIYASTLLQELQRFKVAYKLTMRKIVFLLPLFYIFKKFAWLLGFIKANIDGYGHA